MVILTPTPAESPARIIVFGSCKESRYRYAAKQSCNPQGKGNCGANRYRDANKISLRQISPYLYLLHIESAFIIKILLEIILPSKHPSLKLPRMSLHLIPMLIHTSKEIGTTMHIQHHPLPTVPRLLPLMIVRSHLNPFCSQLTPRSSPLPPRLSSNLLDPIWTQLVLYSIRSSLNEVLTDFGFVYFDPVGMRDPLGCEALNIFDCVVGGVD